MSRTIAAGLRAAGAALLALASAACVHPVGARDVPRDRFDYNEAVALSGREQLLLNIVRLRYLDPVSFIEVSSVTSQYTIERAGALSGTIDVDDLSLLGDSLGANAGVLMSESPVVSYSPLRGAEYAERLMTPIPPETLFLLSQSGWSVERLMLCCVERFGGMVNARSATGPTPQLYPDNLDFRRLAADFRQLQVDDDFVIDVIPGDDDTSRVQINFRPDASGVHAEEISAFIRRFDIPFPDRPVVVTPIVSQAVDEGDNDLFVRGRTVLGILYALSHTVDVPAEHSAYVVTSRAANGGDMTWEGVLNGIFDVRTSPTRPREAFAAVEYRGHWFYIPDTDINTKATFDLVGHLFALQASVGEGATPLLTIGG